MAEFEVEYEEVVVKTVSVDAESQEEAVIAALDGAGEVLVEIPLTGQYVYSVKQTSEDEEEVDEIPTSPLGISFDEDVEGED